MISPYPAQEQKIDDIAKHLAPRFAILDTSKTGTGKTYTALWAARRLGVKPFVVCPKSTIPVWMQASDDLNVNMDDVVNYEKLRAGSHKRMWSKTATSIRNRKKITSFFCKWVEPLPKLVVFDEAHACSGMKSQLSTLMMQTFWQNIPCLLLTATAAESPLKMKAIGHLLGLHNNIDYYRWIESLGCRYIEGRGWKFYAGPQGLQYMAGLNNKLVEEKRLVQITTDDLPNAINDGIIIPELRDVKMPKELSGLKVADDFTLMRQLIEEAKMDVFIEDAEELLDEGNSVICFVNFHKSVNKLAEAFPDAAILTGLQNQNERNQALSDFQDNVVQMLITTIPVGGVSLSMHDIHGDHPRVSLISPTYNANQFIQVLGRTVRVGGKSIAIRKIIFANNTLEKSTYKTVRRKINAIDTLTDGELNTFEEK
jgi:superfamily II DNA or RNA helicase